MANLKRKALLGWISAVALLALAEVAVLALCIGASVPAQAQRFEQRRSGGGFFEQLFGGGGFQSPRFEERPQPQVDSSRAPPPHKPETPPTTSIVVMGDSMADWLAYGLEDAFSDTPEVGVVRKYKTFSGLIRYEARSDMDWPHAVRDILAADKADYVVMMIGLADRTAFRETPPPKKGKDAAKDQNKDANKDQTKEASTDTPPQPDDAEQSSIATPEPKRTPGGPAEFRSDRWVELYTKRIDETIAALKSKGVPVLWVGLPAIRGPKSTADVVFLNDLFRARAEKAGITYVDVWDGFVDEAGRYSQMGPDLEGQTRRLRSADGVHFTKFGARKLAHYVEREIRRMLQGHAVPVALPGPGVTPAPDARQGTTVRPLAGPVMPLNVVPAGSDELAGGGAPRQANVDPVATRVLARGEAITPAPGRADDFAWPRGSARVVVEPASAPPAVPATASISPAAPAAAASPPAPAAGAVATAPNEPGQAQPAAQPTTTQRKGTVAGSKPRPPQPLHPAPQRPVARSFNPFGWIR
ncbi:MAG TPA: SGNH family hydrolase [Pseudolabrys sp.]|nr:SGNH family hydrolase [Pseudolabrys sp.]